MTALSIFIQSLALQTDVVRDALEKDPKERSPEDLDILLRFTQELEAFKPFTMGVTKAFCEGISRNDKKLCPLKLFLILIRYLDQKYLSFSDGVRRSRKGWNGSNE